MPQPHGTYHRRKKDLRWFKFRLKLYGFSFILSFIFIGLVYVLRDTPLFQVKAIEIQGVEKEEYAKILASLNQSVFKTRAAKLFGTESYFAWQNKETKNEKYESISVQKKIFKRKVLITAKPRVKFGIWCRENESERHCWSFDDKEAIAIEETLEGEGHLITKIIEKNNEKVIPGHSLVKNVFFTNIKKIISSLNQMNISVKRFEINNTHQEFSAITTEGAKIIFSLRFDPSEESLPALERALKTNSLLNINYIDFSVENKMYIKRK